jgi:hypothetical protein
MLSTQLVLFLPPLHVLTLAGHVYVYVAIPILIMYLLTAADIFRGVPVKQEGFVGG